MLRGHFALAAALLLTLLAPRGPLAAGAWTAAAPSYTITEIPPFLNASISEAAAINNVGQVVGTSDYTPDGAQHAFLWQSEAMTDLGTLGGETSLAFDINTKGQVVGAVIGDYQYAGVHKTDAFIWQGGQKRTLGELLPTKHYPGNYARAVNDAGQIAGESGGRAALWQQDGRVAELRVPAGVISAVASGINASGQVVGKAFLHLENGGLADHAFLWSRGTATDLGTLSDCADSAALGINAAGWAVGWANCYGGEERAVLWQDRGTLILVTLGGERSHANGINAMGQIVGWSTASDGVSHGVIWQDGEPINLDNLLAPDSSWDDLRPIRINDMGQIVGSGRHNGQRERAFVMTPVTPMGRYFPETGKALGGRFYTYWQTHGGLAINGYPLGEPVMEKLEDGRAYLVQYFERARFEYHPETADPRYHVLLGQVGRTAHRADPFVAPQAGYVFFAPTGHNVTARFGAFWDANGGLAQFGYPLTEELTEKLEDGKPYRVQYFERARLEYHPETADPRYHVQLGQLGRQILGNR